MHVEALDFCFRASLVTGPVFSAIEYGAKDVNGNARECWPGTEWTGLDLNMGPGVDIVQDACIPIDTRYTLALSTEMLEHCADPRLAFQNMVEAATDWVLVTCATYGRAPHSAIDGGTLRAGEYYQNIDPSDVEHPDLEVVMFENHRDRGDMYGLWHVARRL